MLGPLLLSFALAAAGADWMTDDGSTLQLMVARVENGKLCGAYLKVNRVARSLVLEPAPAEYACKKHPEVPASDVKSVKTGDGAGFLVELASGKKEKLLLIPLPHAQWLLVQPMVNSANVGQQLETAGIRDRDGAPMHVGGASGSGGPRKKEVKLPDDVVADTKRAADAVNAALAGR